MKGVWLGMVAAAVSATAAEAVTVSWTDWQTSTLTSAGGSIISGSGTVDVSLTAISGGNLDFVQTGTGTNF